MEKLETITVGTEWAAEEECGLCPVNEEEVLAAEEGAKGMKKLLGKLGDLGAGLHWKPFPWRRLFQPRNALIGACIALVVVAGILNVRFSTPLTDVPSAPTDVQDTLDSDTGAQEKESIESFFAQAVISRERVRDEAIDVLRELTEDESADALARQEAFDQMNRLAEEISSEVNIENLVRSKGFQQCVAVVNQESVNVIVQSEGLTPGEVAQIKEIVYVQTGVLPKSIKIIEKSAGNEVAAPSQSLAPLG